MTYKNSPNVKNVGGKIVIKPLSQQARELTAAQRAEREAYEAMRMTWLRAKLVGLGLVRERTKADAEADRLGERPFMLQEHVEALRRKYEQLGLITHGSRWFIH